MGRLDSKICWFLVNGSADVAEGEVKVEENADAPFLNFVRKKPDPHFLKTFIKDDAYVFVRCTVS